MVADGAGREARPVPFSGFKLQNGVNLPRQGFGFLCACRGTLAHPPLCRSQ
jgi:hypothetical protein